MSLDRTASALGAFYRRLAARTGKAITATARKLAVLVYRMLSGDLIYNDPGATAYHQLNRARELKRCANAPSSSGPASRRWPTKVPARSQPPPANGALDFAVTPARRCERLSRLP